MFDGLPKWIFIHPYKIEVIVRDKLDDDAWGCYNFGVSIELKKTHPNAAMAIDTLLHEINHGVYRNSGLSELSQEEPICAAMATGWTSVLISNPKLVAWLTKAAKRK